MWGPTGRNIGHKAFAAPYGLFFSVLTTIYYHKPTNERIVLYENLLKRSQYKRYSRKEETELGQSGKPNLEPDHDQRCGDGYIKG